MALYAIEWTHGDGMDQHGSYADLTEEQAIEIRDLLTNNGGLNVEVYQPWADTYENLVREIKDDLVEEEDLPE